MPRSASLAGCRPPEKRRHWGWATALPKRHTTTTSSSSKPHSYYIFCSGLPVRNLRGRPQIRPEAHVEVGDAGSGPPQPQGLLGPGGGLGEVFDLDPDDGAPDDGRDLVVGPATTASELGVQAMPGLHGHGAVATVLDGELVVGGGPAVGLAALEPVAMAAGSAHGAGGRLGRVGVEHPVVADAHQQLST